MTDESDHSESLYRIGAVSRLTGIEIVTLRMWERRYRVVEPRRTESGARLYSREDIGRLALIKRLVDDGNAIGTVANLDLEQLQARLRGDVDLPQIEPPESKASRIAVLGDALPALVSRRRAQLEDVDAVIVERDRQAFSERCRLLRPEILVLEYPTVHDETADEVNLMMTNCGAEQAVVVYGFGRRQAVARLDSPTVTPLRAPIDIAELRNACLPHRRRPAATRQTYQQAPPMVEGAVPKRLFSEEEMLRLEEASGAVDCECPRHLVDLVRNLASFERYSQECRDRNPQDAALHGYLYLATAHARALVEEALAHVAEAEGLGRNYG